MKKILAVLLCLMLLAAVHTGLAEETAETVEYRDEVYAFRYPAGWTQRFDYDGSLILELPGTQSSVITFALISNAIRFSGDEQADRALADSFVAGYDEESQREKGKNTTLNGEYDLIEHDGMYGIRAYGTWLLSGENLVMILLTGEDHLVAFQLNGPDAIALEEELLDSTELLGGLDETSSEEWSRWEGAGFSMDYPSDYSATESTDGVIFIDLGNPNNIVAGRFYDIDMDYTDNMAAILATNLLPKSTKISADAATEQVGGRTVAVIRGSVDAGPLEFYVFGSGHKVFALLVTGEEAISLADHFVESVELKP